MQQIVHTLEIPILSHNSPKFIQSFYGINHSDASLPLPITKFFKVKTQIKQDFLQINLFDYSLNLINQFPCFNEFPSYHLPSLPKVIPLVDLLQTQLPLNHVKFIVKHFDLLLILNRIVVSMEQLDVFYC